MIFKSAESFWENGWMGEITDQNQIDAIADDIDTHLEAYTELLMNKEVK